VAEKEKEMAKSKTIRDVITQAEMSAVLVHYQAAMEAGIAIRKRLDQGAFAEPGRYFLQTDPGSPANEYITDKSEGLSAWGLEILDAHIYMPEPAKTQVEVTNA